MSDDMILRLLRFFEGMTAEERRTLHLLLVVANGILAELVEEDEDEQSANL